jgi:hypothetical protein
VQKPDEIIYSAVLALSYNLNPAIRQVAHPSSDAKLICLAHRVCAQEDALHLA